MRNIGGYQPICEHDNPPSVPPPKNPRKGNETRANKKEDYQRPSKEPNMIRETDGALAWIVLSFFLSLALTAFIVFVNN
jgi:hypothetical protein